MYRVTLLRSVSLLSAGLLTAGLLAAPVVAADGETSMDLAVPPETRIGEPQRAAQRADEPVARRAVLRRTTEGSAPPSDRQRLTRVQVEQDLRAGRLVARATFAAAPSEAAQSVVVVYLGTWDGSSCVSDAAVLASGFETSGQDAAGQLGDGTALGVKRSRSGATVTIRSTNLAARVKAAAWECSFATLRSPDATADYQGLYAEELVPAYAPQLQIDAGEPVQGAYAGKWTSLRLEVFNASQSPATGVRLKASGTGLKIRKPARSLGTIDNRSTEYGITYAVRLKGAKSRPLTFTATTGGRKFTQRVLIARKPKPTRYASLNGRYFWGHLPASTDVGWDLRAIWFLDGRWAYIGFPPKGKQPRCAKESKRCQRYTYQRGSGTARIGGKTVRIDSEGFDYAGATFYPTTLARKGQKYDVQLIRNDFVGTCGIGCTTWTEWLSMDRKGRFVLSRQTIGSIGAPGVGSIWAGMPPDERGRYRVLGRGRVQLTFANGDREQHLLAVDHDVRNVPSPAGAGLILGDRNFYLD